MSSYGVVLVTAPTEAEANQLAGILIQEKLAACISVLPVRSIYPWKGEICNEAEWQLLIKTDLAHFETLSARIQAVHSYEVPEIIALPIAAGSSAYLSWLSELVQPSP